MPERDGIDRPGIGSAFDRPIGAENEAATEPFGIVAVGQGGDRLPPVGAQAGGKCRVVAERQQDAPVGVILGAKPVVDQRIGTAFLGQPLGIVVD